MKTCTRCDERKPPTEFYRNARRKDNLCSACKDCMAEAQRRFRRENPEHCRARERVWYEKNAKQVRATVRARYAASRERIKERDREYRRRNPDKIREYNQRRRSDPKMRVEHSVRARINASIWRRSKTSGVWEILGYTRADLLAHLEEQFEPGMTWENYGEWHIDHIVPVSAFNYTKPSHPDFGRAWALSNLRPLWAEDNLSKGARLDRPFQPSLTLEVG